MRWLREGSGNQLVGGPLATDQTTDSATVNSRPASASDVAAPCVFCSLDPHQVVRQNSLALAFRDRYPVTEGHTLVIPKRHVADIFDLDGEEAAAVVALLAEERQALQACDPNIQGFNVGANAGAAAGQTVFHCHVHLIPRRNGDVPDPRGGVRHVIPGKGNYSMEAETGDVAAGRS